ncbi:MAG: prepilin-type N-terminal cleavage/methylation domain-containing protein [Phycisphaerales bacterium]|nr:prepilin-type N-terminal cleavage/methylation domain-containing protein [Planctomycetota bacterium]
MLNRAFGRWPSSRASKAGFTLIELLIVIAIIALLIGILLPALGEARRYAKMTQCMTNERSYGTATNSFANENKDLLPAPNWRRGQPMAFDLPGWESKKGQYYASDLEAAAHQVVWNIRKKTGLSDAAAPVPSSWICYILYSHIPLTDYIGGQLPSPASVCPEDSWRVAMQRKWSDPASTGLPYPAGNGDGSLGIPWRWPFSTSYTINQSHWGPSRQTYRMSDSGKASKSAIWYPDPSAGGNSYTADGDQSLNGQYGIYKIGDVRFPSSKTIMSDEWSRHFGRKALFYAAPEAKAPLVFYDGSVRVFQTAQTTPGWDPSNAGNRSDMTAHFQFTKNQAEYDPTMNPVTGSATLSNGDKVGSYRAPAGWYKFTRGGLFGWDVPRAPGPGGKFATLSSGGTASQKLTGQENELDTSPTTGKW